jgi:phosphoglycerate kinase
MSRVPSLEDLGDVSGKRVLVRTDFNVPMEGSDDARTITDDFRIRAALPTIEYLTSRGAQVVCASHLGRPKGSPNAKYSMAPVRARLAELAPGVELLENLRFNPGEEGNDPAFVKQLIEGIDMYVDDAFGAAHRSHASIVGPSQTLPSAAGRLLQREVDVLGDLREKPKRPFVAVLGGAKVSDKLGVIENLLGKVDVLAIGGGMVFTFLKAQGKEIGTSLVEAEMLDVVTGLIATAEKNGVKLLLPTDIVVAPTFSADATPTLVSADAIPADQMGLDIGPVSAAAFAAEIVKCKTLFWNGPMGVFEFPNFAAGTKVVAQALTQVSGISVVGGGDSAAAVRALGFADSQFGYISTGGGASLEYLEGKELPGLTALELI